MCFVRFFGARIRLRRIFSPLENTYNNLYCVHQIYTIGRKGNTFLFSSAINTVVISAHLPCLAPVVLDISRGLLRKTKCVSLPVFLHKLTFIWGKEQRADRDSFSQSIKLRIDRYGTRAIDHYSPLLLDAFKCKCT